MPAPAPAGGAPKRPTASVSAPKPGVPRPVAAGASAKAPAAPAKPAASAKAPTAPAKPAPGAPRPVAASAKAPAAPAARPAAKPATATVKTAAKPAPAAPAKPGTAKPGTAKLPPKPGAKPGLKGGLSKLKAAAEEVADDIEGEIGGRGIQSDVIAGGGFDSLGDDWEPAQAEPKQREFIMTLIFMLIVPFGLYGLIWWFKIHKEIPSRRGVDPSPIMAVIFGLIPILNIFGVLKYTDRVNALASAVLGEQDPVPRKAALWMCIGGLIPCVGPIISLICLFKWLPALCTTLNKLAQAKNA